MLARGERAAIGVCDLIGFTAVNARHGRHCGDLVLQRIAGVLNRVMRRGDFVARFAGDEFVVVLPGAGPAQAAEVSRRISAAAAGGELAGPGAGHADRAGRGLVRGRRERPYPQRRPGRRGREPHTGMTP